MKKILSFALILVVLVGLLPQMTLAVRAEEAAVSSTGFEGKKVTGEEGGTACGAERSNMANLEGKVISILGDSISTFAGYIPTADGFNLGHLSRYPDADRIPDVTEAEQTWWMQVITELDAKLGINDSWRGAMVSGAAAVTTGTTGPNAAMSNLQRIRNLGANGTPDVILFYGGTNDYAHLSAIGTFDPAAAPVEADLTTTYWNNLADAYVQTLLRLRHYYPDAMIVAMLPTYTDSYYSDAKLSQGNAVLAEICAHYGIPSLDLRSSGVTAAHLPDGIHPGAEGMDLIADAVVDLLLSQCNPEVGENVVYSVTHDLSGASASLSYFKGVTHGSVFSESLTGDDLDVTVTMGGIDITDLCYADGKITISSVTGNLMITAKGKFNADGHLQMLPEELCCSTNLWSVLEHDKQYYTIDGWGIHNSGRVYSVTFPISENDRIYATSFGAGSVNGSGGTNGIRVTYFFEDGSVRSLSADTVYSEFSANGYLTMPAGVLAVSVPMWTVSDSNELYSLNRDHCYENGACTDCGAYEWDTDSDGALEILAIGNSFSVDALEYAYQIAQNLGIEEIVLGNLYIGGCSLNTHATNAAGDLAKYTYYYNDNGTWKTTTNYKISTALESRSWDFVSLQQASNFSGVESTYNEDLTNLIAYVQERSDAKLVWHMTWAYQQNSTHSAFPTYKKDQMTMHNAIVSAVQNKIVTNSNFDLIVPNGTAVQNSRTSLLGDTTTRDGYHMSYDYGRYLTGLLFIKTVTGLSIDDITYAPAGVDAEEMSIAIESVNNAAARPFEVTQSAYVEEEPEIPDEGYILLQPELYKGAYWYPTDAKNYNVPVADASNSKYYFATIRFTREELPVGSIIVLEDGWQYRPDGWITDTVQSGRADTTTQAYTVVTEEWWGDYSIRGFNIAKVGTPSLMSLNEEDIHKAFRIYVPEESHTHTYASAVTAPTCTEQGYTTHTCVFCGESRVDSYVDAAGHSYGEWTEVSAPTKDVLGVQQRVCACGSTESQEVEGVWQMYDLADHLLELPENVCCDTNLWASLPHENVHFTSGKRWGTNSTPVTSITIPLNPGDRVYATSWNKAGENGHDTLNGIRLTFFNAYGIAQTLGPGESYSKFAANGGYLVAPEEAIAINIAMWYDSEDYEVYILNREHTYEDVTVAPSCSEQGYSGTICLGCGDGETHSYTEALGHLLTTHEANAPTCTDVGWETYETCSRCEHSTYTEIFALGHNYGKWEQITAPTCHAEGQDKSVCTNCDETVIRDTRISGDPGKILVSNPVPEGHYEGKRILAIGDSLTAGTGVTTEQRYHALLAKRLNATNISGGTSGATLCPGGHLPNKFETLMTANYLIKNNIDIVTIFLGINDWDNGVVNGTYQGKLKYDESLTYYDLGEFGTDDTTTIYGAAKMWCERILELKATAGCEDIQFVFATSVITSWNKSVTTARDWNQDKVNVFGYTLRQYCTAIMEVCAYYEIPVLDLNMYSGMYYHSENDNNVDYFGGDGIHPGVNGHAMMADAFEEFLLEGYTYEFRNVYDCGHNFEKTVTKATCTEGGFTTYRCSECHYSYVDDHVDVVEHDYENGSCTHCGAEQPGPVIVTQPENAEAALGENYCVTVEAQGDGLKYQWYFRNAGSDTWYKSGVRDNTYDDVMTTTRAGREIYCVITDANGNSVTSNTVKLIRVASETLEIIIQPSNSEALLGETFCVTVEAKGEGLKYQWYFRNAGSDTWYKSGVRDNTYDDVMTKARAGREVYCVITDAFGNSVTTDIVKLIRVPAKLEITSQPADATAAFDEMFCATVEAKGEGLKYQWYYRNAGSDTWYKSGVRDNTYDDVMTKARNGREIYCVITDAYGNTVTTDVVRLIAVPKVELKLLTQATNAYAAMGENYCVTVEAQGEELRYQWYFRNAGSSQWYKSSVTDNNYDDVMTKARANREVYCVITDAFGNQIVTEVVTLVLTED